MEGSDVIALKDACMNIARSDKKSYLRPLTLGVQLQNFEEKIEKIKMYEIKCFEKSLAPDTLVITNIDFGPNRSLGVK